MKTILMFLAVIILKILYLPFMSVKVKDKITFFSRQSDKATIDIKFLDEALRVKGIETVVLTRKLNKTVSSAVKYFFHMIRQMYHISTSKVLVLDGYCILASILPKKSGQQIIQIWHSLGAIKKFGYQSVGMPSGNNPEVAKIMKLYEKYDYVIAPSKATAEYYSEAFKIPEERIKLYGLPRIDYLLTEDEEKEKSLEKLYPGIVEKENILCLTPRSATPWLVCPRR